MKKSQAFFNVSAPATYSNYGHLEVSLYVRADYPTYPRKVAKVTFQSNRFDVGATWYAGHVHVIGSSLEDLKIAAAACQSFGIEDEITSDFLDNLTDDRRVVYDDRLMEPVILTDLMPEEYDLWYDNFKKYCTVRVWARNEEEARMLLSAEFAKEQETEAFTQWVAAGMPVRNTGRFGPTNIKTLSEALDPTA